MINTEEKNKALLNTFKRFNRLRIGTMIENLNHSDFATLMNIECCEKECSKNDEEVKVSMVTDRMHVNSTAVSRSLKSLEEKGYIERRVGRKDRRITYVSLTEEGRRVLKEATKKLDDFTDAVFKKFGEENIESLMYHLDRLYEVAAGEIELRKCSMGKDLGKDNKKDE